VALDADTLRFVSDPGLCAPGGVCDEVSFGLGELPLDGVLSLHRDNPGGTSGADPPGGLSAAANTPTNFDGEVGMLPEPRVGLLRVLALGLLTVCARGRRRR
jgi:hypothetical protein